MKTILACLMLCAPMMAHAAEGAAPPPVEKEKKICRAEEVTGSLFAKRVCHTKSEWAAVEAERRQGADNLNNRRNGNGVDLPR